MPQAALPDINTILITHRGHLLADLRNKNYSGVIGSLYAMNAALPEDYQITISTKAYNEKVNKSLIATCNFCNQITEYQNMRIYERRNNSIEYYISNLVSEKVWNCVKCSKTNKLSKTKIVKPIPQKPFYVGVVPEPPERRDGTLDRSKFHKLFIAWARNFLVELERMMGKYRIEYQPKDTDDDESLIDDSGEDLDIDS